MSDHQCDWRCNQGRNCGDIGREFPALDWRTGLVAAAAIAAAAWLSSIFPLGWAAL